MRSHSFTNEYEGMRIVKVVRRILGVVVVILASLGILLCAGGIVGVWVIKRDVQDSLVSILSSVGGVVQRTDNALGEVNTTLQGARDNLIAAGDTARKRGDKAIEATPARDMILNALSDQSFPRISLALETAGNVRETALAVNGVIQALNRVPGVSLPTLPGERLQPVVDELAAARATAQELRDNVRDTKADAVNSIVSAVTERTNRIDNQLAGVQESINEIQAQVRDVNARITAGTDSGTSLAHDGSHCAHASPAVAPPFAGQHAPWWVVVFSPERWLNGI